MTASPTPFFAECAGESDGEHYAENASCSEAPATGSKMELVQPASAVMPSEEIRRIIDDALASASPEPWEVSAHATARIEALFAPILAEKERHERYRAFVHAVFGYNAPDANTERTMTGVIAGEIAPPWPLPEVMDRMGLVPASRALAAEAALAAERALLVRAKDHIVQYADDLSMHSPATKLVEEIAAAIRAQGE